MKKFQIKNKTNLWFPARASVNITIEAYDKRNAKRKLLRLLDDAYNKIEGNYVDLLGHYDVKEVKPLIRKHKQVKTKKKHEQIIL